MQGQAMNRQLTPQVLARWKQMAELRKKHSLRVIGEMLGVSLWSVFKCLNKYQELQLSRAHAGERPDLVNEATARLVASQRGGQGIISQS